MSATTGVVEVRDLVKVFDGESPTTVLRGLDLDVATAEVVGLIGPSGCGKSTLLRILAGLDTPTAGTIVMDGRRVDGMDRQAAVHHRRHTVGVVRQGADHNLVTHLDAKANVALAGAFAGTGAAHRAERAAHLLDLVGLADRIGARPSELSGGQQQRVALAAALINEPAVVLADEPTSALDRRTSEQVWGLLDHLRRQLGTTIIVVSHEHALADHVDRVVHMADGSIAAEHSAVDADGTTVVDQRGRVRLPPEWLDQQGRPDRVRIERRGDDLIIRGDDQ
jgi:ABC-type lipoprotein export system ATPase subunit